MIIKCLLSAPILFAFTSVNAMQYQVVEMQQQRFDVIQVQQLNQLELFLKNPQTNQYYQKFSRIEKQLPACAQLKFAMNAGMYHADFQAVGLYVEKGKQKTKLNEATGEGNFFMQPNGVLAWNTQHAVIQNTTKYKQHGFKALYATQSGPMLLSKNQINPRFLPNSTSLKIRNAVGIKEQKLYFVMSQQPVSFYQLAQFFKDKLNISDALYLDGSISSLYVAESNRNDHYFKLGPIVAVVDRTRCTN